MFRYFTACCAPEAVEETCFGSCANDEHFVSFPAVAHFDDAHIRLDGLEPDISAASSEELVALPPPASSGCCPTPTSSAASDPEEARLEELKRICNEFVAEMRAGMTLQQVTAGYGHTEIHLQLMPDMTSLKVDQGNGCIIEFPLLAVSKVYHIIKCDDRWYHEREMPLGHKHPSAEHVAVIEFMRRKLALVLADGLAVSRMLMCIELLIRRVQQQKESKAGLLQRKKATAAPREISSIFAGVQFEVEETAARFESAGQGQLLLAGAEKKPPETPDGI